MQNEKSNDIEDIQFWERMELLIGDERPFPWSERIGLNRSAFQSARARGKRPLPKTVKKWAEQIGCSYGWLNSGIGKPYETASLDATVAEVKLAKSEQLESKGLDATLLQQAFDTLEQALEATGRIMQPKGVSRFVATVYASLKEDEDMDTEVLQDCILTVEEALKSTRRNMSSKAKTDLILAIYELYSGNALYKEAMTSTINQLIRSVS
ncbi:hypothetical protein [Acinetobacter sp.]|uniref:hypothetical protein n=1 Tax=Acinetobacter sp. TaxID=472 RepID=UPI0028A5D1BF|nr:hypothetical protein [Acinetobacter sp.]